MVDAQPSPLEVLKKIRSMQVQNHPFYDEGLFPVARSWNGTKDPVDDNTIFFSASIAQTLKELEPFMDLESKMFADSIVRGVIKNIHRYKSRNGAATFNFWQTLGDDLPFPNGNSLISNPKMRLPDDLDTSVIIAMATEDEVLKKRLRTEMVEYAGRDVRKESDLSTLTKYDQSMGYEAWFADKMTQTFDICVMSNAIHFVLQEGYVLNTYDSATIDMITQIIEEDDYKIHVDDVSHHTTSEALILYHVARALSADRVGFFDHIKPKVKYELAALARTAETTMERMLALTALTKLQGHANEVVNHDKIVNEMPTFVFFSVKPFLGNPQYSFLNGVIPKINWTCQAYNWTLYLEYLYLNKTFLSDKAGIK